MEETAQTPSNLMKLAAGVKTREEFEVRVAHHLAASAARGLSGFVVIATLNHPKRHVRGGSLYWVFGGSMQCRQAIVAVGQETRPDGKTECLIVLDPEIAWVRKTQRKPFQGWRYLAPEASPPDLARAGEDDVADMPEAMRDDLIRLGVL